MCSVSMVHSPHSDDAFSYNLRTPLVVFFRVIHTTLLLPYYMYVDSAQVNLVDNTCSKTKDMLLQL